VIRLISAGLLLAGAFAASAAAFRWLLGPAASVPGGLGTAGQVITGLVQVACLAAAGLTAGILALLGAERPATLTANQARGSWLASAAFPAPALLAAAVAVVVAAASLRSSLASLWRVARSPVRLALLFGGSALVTLAYIGGLVASVAAVGASASIAEVGAVYLIASFIAAASPTPGGLGAIEAATIAGLTGIGISSGPAVSAVLVYRLATYWLPVLPGWYSWRVLQRMDYL
jgi:undecaprenyl-diphosphatase